MLAMFGPPNAPPLESRWMFEWNIFCTDTHLPDTKNKFKEYESISRTQRALLWYAGRPFDKYKNCVVTQKCRFAPELEPLSVVFRVDPKDAEPNALVWVRRRRGPRRRRDLSYLKVARNHFYHLNITFANGATVHQYVHQLGWRFTLFLPTKRQARTNFVSLTYVCIQRSGVDEISMTRLYTNFSTAWVNGNEPAPDTHELKMAEDARALDALEDKEDQMAPPPASGGSGSSSASTPLARLPPQGMAMSVDSSTTTSKERSLKVTEMPQVTAALPSTMHAAMAENVTAAMPSMLPAHALVRRSGDSSTVTQTASDHFTPMIPIPAQPSAHQMAALLQHIGVTNPPRIQPQGPPRPKKAVKDCTWQGDVMVLLPGKAADYDPPEHDELMELGIKLDFSLDATVESFIKFKCGDGSLAATMCDVERVAKVAMNTFSAVSQLPGWQHVQDYIIDPAGYIDRSGILRPNEPITVASRAAQRLIRDDNVAPLQEQGKQLLTQLCTRVAWLLRLRAAAPPTERELAVRGIVFYLASDRKWIADAQQFMKEAELRVTQMLTRNPSRFAQFRELQKKGVAWPHSGNVRRDIETAGFSFRPMMVKRDRCVCDTCLVEASGWRPWHNPWLFHDYGRHPPSFRAPS